MELYLLRHGCSEANELGLVTGDKDDALTSLGRKQALDASRTLDVCGLNAAGAPVFYRVSDWRRAAETASLIAPDREFVCDARLGETDAGSAAYLPVSEFNRLYPEFWTSFDPRRRYPNGESHQDLFARVLAWLEDEERTLPADSTILAVSHTGPVCCLLQAICKVDMAYFPMFRAGHASLTKMERSPGEPWRLAFFSLPPFPSALPAPAGGDA
jgi:broad specificity phosphatase PhoE